MSYARTNCLSARFCFITPLPFPQRQIYSSYPPYKLPNGSLSSVLRTRNGKWLTSHLFKAEKQFSIYFRLISFKPIVLVSVKFWKWMYCEIVYISVSVSVCMKLRESVSPHDACVLKHAYICVYSTKRC